MKADCPRASAHRRSRQLAGQSHSCLRTRVDEHHGRWSLHTTGHPPARNRRESRHTPGRGGLRGHHPSETSSHGRTKSACFREPVGRHGVREQGGRSWKWEAAWGPSTGTGHQWGAWGGLQSGAHTQCPPHQKTVNMGRGVLYSPQCSGPPSLPVVVPLPPPTALR